MNSFKTYLELGFAHGAVESVLERLVLEIEFNVVLVRAIADCDVKVDLDGTLGNRSKFVRLGELNVIPERQPDFSKCSLDRASSLLTATRCRTLGRRTPG